MKEIFIVVSDSGNIMGTFSDRKTADACKKHYEYRLPGSMFSIYVDYLDLFSAKDYEDLDQTSINL